ncbi:ImmA/IrrE family metallo-endopeptidase [Staphylococcus simulans]|uniref:ImmA/IrrE family metallo-endopeptidase n=1 Tax=Staphylococcus simulans TaxID=1286 RepID=UPI000E683F18|nr:ImmA/IrrE family metallo-endopeptidase [Staphylococcus simulans]RIN77822.1 ImmA/IrrE family metallo-endopeptidase [Staphylococcus simulans]
MGKYEDLLSQNSDISVIETNKLPHFQSGIYINGEVYINSNRPTIIKHETLAEELAHHQITYGNILDQSEIQNRKYELKARRLANESVISLDGIIDCFKFGVCNLHEMAQYFEVTEKFIINTILHYKQKYGLSTCHNGFLITFEPLHVYKYIEKE